MAPAYLAWKAFYHDRIEAAVVDLETVADQLAQAVQKQWDHEAAIRRVNDPYPLSVAWRPAEPDLVEPWPLLAEVARAWPGGPPGDPARWPGDAAGLTGAAAQIGEVFTQRVPTRRLVVLGEPGAGKTVLLIRLLQDLIAQRPDGGLVPVLISLASWDPRQPLQGWLADQLRRSYPGLRTAAPQPMVGADPVDLAQALLDARRILPLLDGFDELPPALHAYALDALNLALPAKQSLVLASRATAYRTAVQRSGALVRLNGAAGIHLLPLTPDQAAAYLSHDAGGEHTAAADRWTTVAAHLGTDTPVGEALSTPLGLFLTRTIYNPRPHTPAIPRPVPHPDELCDSTAFPTRDALNTHLFNAFIPAAYTAHHTPPSRWSGAQAYRTFVLLARHLETNRGGSPDLAWWELRHAVPAYVHRLAAGLTFGLLFGLTSGLAFGHIFGHAIGYAIGLVCGLTLGLVFGLVFPPASAPSARPRWTSGPLIGSLAFGLAGGLASALTVGRTAGLAFGLLAGLTVWLPGGIAAEKSDLTTMVGPAALLNQDRRVFLTIGLAGGLVYGLAFGLAVGIAFGLAVGIAGGIAFGLAFGIAFGIALTAWTGLVVARSYMAVRHKVPRDLMTLLRDAHEHRGVLRQVGAVYQFRHLDLQRHLAQQPWPPTI
ncbi:NACHT domain-containing protein [Streptomyces sp. NPDC002730]|uniref:NACHT domain-containing protein n=1 Tax=Streptomyces sp. NPDC002730 TaxID=3364662 RepID=UPI00369EC61D